ncbi:hypothetical protein DFH09DRAFT_1174755 [Mycena vulgaris]|nr:hypothetical protein DFH09DRAFT_1174755 [Mycena vulgaris]
MRCNSFLLALRWTGPQMGLYRIQGGRDVRVLCALFRSGGGLHLRRRGRPVESARAATDVPRVNGGEMNNACGSPREFPRRCPKLPTLRFRVSQTIRLDFGLQREMACLCVRRGAWTDAHQAHTECGPLEEARAPIRSRAGCGRLCRIRGVLNVLLDVMRSGSMAVRNVGGWRRAQRRRVSRPAIPRDAPIPPPPRSRIPASAPLVRCTALDPGCCVAALYSGQCLGAQRFGRRQRGQLWVASVGLRARAPGCDEPRGHTGGSIDWMC